MKKAYLTGVLLVVTVLLLAVYFYFRVPKAEAPTQLPLSATTTKAEIIPVPQTDGYKNTSYLIEGDDIMLKNGSAETPSAPGSPSMNLTDYFGNEVTTDLNADGKQDVVFLLTHQTGGTGVFYYIVAALKTDSGYKGSQAFFIGDRIAPQTTEVKEGVIIVNYADRKVGATFAEIPTEAKSLQLQFEVASMKFIKK